MCSFANLDLKTAWNDSIRLDNIHHKCPFNVVSYWRHHPFTLRNEEAPQFRIQTAQVAIADHVTDCFLQHLANCARVLWTDNNSGYASNQLAIPSARFRPTQEIKPVNQHSVVYFKAPFYMLSLHYIHILALDPVLHSSEYSGTS